MTPKQAYEARKAERAKLRDMDFQIRQKQEQIETLDMFDRFVTAVERIADALEARPVTDRAGTAPKPYPTTFALGCRSSVRPCRHQQMHPGTLCDACLGVRCAECDCENAPEGCNWIAPASGKRTQSNA